MLHLFKHSAEPIILPVPTAGIFPAMPTMSMTAGFCPKAARTSSGGRLKRPFAMLWVPASSEFNAETRVAFPQPREIEISQSRAKSHDNIPVFCMVCRLAAGKMVIFPGVSVSFTILAPFSSTIYVSVVPSTATTKFAARG